MRFIIGSLALASVVLFSGCASSSNNCPVSPVAPAAPATPAPSAASDTAALDPTASLTKEWDKTFPQSDKVDHQKVVFKNRFGITIAADLYMPKNKTGKLPAIAVSGPFGAVKEQASGRYAQTLAENGFLTIAFDPSFTGESGGDVRYAVSVDISTEDFSAAVDYLITRDDVDPDKIGILGICGWGGFALNAASMDSRIKAVVTSTMYNMHRVIANGYFDAALSLEGRNAIRDQYAQQRTLDAKNGSYQRIGGVVDPLPDDAPQFVKEYHDYYKTPRGYHKRSLNSTDGFNTTSKLNLLNSSMLEYTADIQAPILLVHGENAHSLYFSKDEFAKLTGENKELYIVPGANHTDLYDKPEFIPFPKIVDFYKKAFNI